MGKAFVAKLAKRGARDPEALAAWIGRHKYGKKAFSNLAEKGARQHHHDTPAAVPRTDARALRQLSDEDLAGLHASGHGGDAARGRIEAELQRRDHEDRRSRMFPGGALARDLSKADDDTLVWSLRYANPDEAARIAAEVDRRYPPVRLPPPAHTGNPAADVLADRRAVDAALGPLGDPDDWGTHAPNEPASPEHDNEPTRHITRAQARQMYSEYVYTQWLAAEDATRGVLLNKRGQAAGINPENLFSGPAHVAFAYASDELKDWWARNERLSQSAFTEQVSGVASGASRAGRKATADLQNRR